MQDEGAVSWCHLLLSCVRTGPLLAVTGEPVLLTRMLYGGTCSSGAPKWMGVDLLPAFTCRRLSERRISPYSSGMDLSLL
jgi:hypothetical protein